MQKNAFKIFSLFTLLFFVMSISGAATTTSTGGKVVEVTKLDQINTALKKGPVLLRLGSSWCSHCKALSPTLQKLAKEYSGKATVMSVDIGKSPKIAKSFGTSAVPDCSVIVGIKNGKYIYMQQNGKTTTTRSQARIIGDKKKSVYEKFLNYAIKK